MSVSKPALSSGGPKGGCADSHVSAAELVGMRIGEPCFVVDQILSEGLTLVGGSPKRGKSWLALGLAVDVALGGLALEKYKVRMGHVLYFALEDSLRRCKKRLHMILRGREAPDNLHIETEWPGGVGVLEDYCLAHGDARLLIIDTFALLRSCSVRGRSSYDADYALLTPIKAVADKFGVSVMVVHHTRKMRSSNPVESLLGTTAIAGAADTVWVLLPGEGEGSELHVTGRDVEACELALEFVDGRWSVVGDADMCRGGVARAKILRALKVGPLRTKEIALAVPSVSHKRISQLVNAMAEDGSIVRKGYGVYSLGMGLGVEAHDEEVLEEGEE